MTEPASAQPLRRLDRVLADSRRRLERTMVLVDQSLDLLAVMQSRRARPIGAPDGSPRADRASTITQRSPGSLTPRDGQ